MKTPIPVDEHIVEIGEIELTAAWRSSQSAIIGMKAAGLAQLPQPWVPPYLIVTSSLYRQWLSSNSEERATLLDGTSQRLVALCSDRWNASWRKGIVVRSSSTDESLNSRGAYDSRELPADFSADAIRRSISAIFSDFASKNTIGSMAIVVQARVELSHAGHLSNERRVSKTVNQWLCESPNLTPSSSRFNSQRTDAMQSVAPITVTNYQLPTILLALKGVARWSTELDLGPAHIEWGISNGTLWLFQQDFEADQPDDGKDPRELLREDIAAREPKETTAPFLRANFAEKTGWGKIDKVSAFLTDGTEKYPSLYYISASDALLASEQQLSEAISGFAGDRVVCRTDVRAQNTPLLNLPRTDTVDPLTAAKFIKQQAVAVTEGVSPLDVCFIVHRFIPARVAAWAWANPHKQIVLVDSLWGLPDGLQYLPHDTFEYDTALDALSSSIPRFKPSFLQETASGSWELLPIRRNLGRRASLSKADIRDVAFKTHKIASRLGKAIQVMWFCDIAPSAGIGSNVPWFMMSPHSSDMDEARVSISPLAHRIPIENYEDLDSVGDAPSGPLVLQLRPDVELYRDNGFLNAVATKAKSVNATVELSGSILSHAYYALARIVPVLHSRPRRRVRQRKVFQKLVRDKIPDKITHHGERAILAQIAKSESRLALSMKLIEEVHELLAAESPKDVTEELADLLEVLQSLCAATGIDWDSVGQAADAKRNSRGSFTENVVLLETSWPNLESDVTGDVRQITMKDLATVSSDGDGRQIVSLAAVLTNGPQNVVRLSDGKNVKVSLRGDGVVIEEVPDSAVTDDPQMTLPF